MAVPTNYANGSTATAANADMSVEVPAGTVARDLLIMAVECARGDAQATPTNWTPHPDNPILSTTAGTGPNRLYLFAKIAVTSEPDPTLTASGDHHIAKILGFRGAATAGTTNPWDAVNIYATGTAASTATPSVAGVTTTCVDCFVLTIIANGTDSGTAQYSSWTNATLSGFGQVSSNNTGLGDGGGIGSAGGGKATAGASGTTGVTLASASKYTFAVLAIMPPIAKSSSDTGAGTDAVSASERSGSQSDTGSGAEANAIGAESSSSDTGAGTDTNALAAAAASAETGAGTDAVTAQAATVAGSETASGTDAASPAATLTGADTAAGVDAGVVVVPLSGTDSGSGSDANTQAVTASSADTAAGTDAVTAQAAAVPGAETAAGTDAAAAAAALAVSEFAAALDASSTLVATLLAEDSAAATDLEVVAITFLSGGVRGPTKTAGGPTKLATGGGPSRIGSQGSSTRTSTRGE